MVYSYKGTEAQSDSPEAPAINRTGKHHIALLWGEVQLGVIHILQASAPVIHLIALFRLWLQLGLCLSLCSLF